MEFTIELIGDIYAVSGYQGWSFMERPDLQEDVKELLPLTIAKYAFDSKLEIVQQVFFDLVTTPHKTFKGWLANSASTGDIEFLILRLKSLGYQVNFQG